MNGSKGWLLPFRATRSAYRPLLLIAALALFFTGSFFGSATAHARSNGAPFRSWWGCHGTGDEEPEIGVSFDPQPVPGEPTTVTVRVADPGIQVAGFFATTGGVGTFRASSNDTELAGDGITHSSPISATGGEATVSFEWTPPSEASGTGLSVYAIAANRDGRSQGDVPGEATFPVAWGCELVVLYADLDRDGVGSESFGLSGGCDVRDGWSTTIRRSGIAGSGASYAANRRRFTRCGWRSPAPPSPSRASATSARGRPGSSSKRLPRKATPTRS